jgi:hypothetical protein
VHCIADELVNQRGCFAKTVTDRVHLVLRSVLSILQDPHHDCMHADAKLNRYCI